MKKKYSLLVILLLSFFILMLSGCDQTAATFKLNLAVYPEEGGEISQLEPGTTIESGETVYLTAEANQGWYFSHWQGDITGSETSKEIVMDGNKTIVAVFMKMEHSLTINIFPEDAGRVEVFIPVQTQDVEHGQTVTVTAKSYMGYSFSHWDDDLIGEENPNSLFVDEEKSITAVFVPSISGQVLGVKSLQGLPGVIIEYPGGEVVTDDEGFFTIKDVDTSEPVELTPKAPLGALGFSANPVLREVNWPNDSFKFSVSWIEFVLQWGGRGTAPGKFTSLYGIAIDSFDNIYVTDAGNYRIQVFNTEGNYLYQWGEVGTGEGQFRIPLGIGVDSEDNIYVTDYENHRVQKFTSEGTFVRKWGEFGTDNGKFNEPWGVAVDSSDNIYIADISNHRIQVFTSTGSFLRKWGEFGSAAGQFNSPLGIALDSKDNVFVVEALGHRVQKFNNAGIYLEQWGGIGTGEGQLYYPYVPGIDSEGLIYVPDRANHRVQKFTNAGNFLSQWGEYGTGEGQFNDPVGVALDSEGCIYVIDWADRVQKFKPVH